MGDVMPTDRAPDIRVVAMPCDTNGLGDIFGGWLMSQVDIAGSIQAVRRANGRVVTVAVNEFRFLRPVFVGDLVSLFAEVQSVGNTSIRITIAGFAERERSIHQCDRVCEAELTYVAIDAQRQPRSVPPLQGNVQAGSSPNNST
ncbi:MAG: acyl-CoA thioesterase [Pseudomonadota bacterium]|nr:MAG: acyl-CoA thioesterase [Pseudomonadota bacterium]